MNKMAKFMSAVAALLLCACAVPKQRYYFDYYSDNQIGAKHQLPPSPSESEPAGKSSPELTNRSTQSSSNNSIVAPLAVVPTELFASAEPVKAGQVKHNDPMRLNSSESGISSLNQHRETVVNQNKNSGNKSDNRKLIRSIKELRKELKRRTSTADPANVEATQKLDQEVIVAIAFGAVGITLSLLGGISAGFWIAGVLCLGAGVFFFVDWLRKR